MTAITDEIIAYKIGNTPTAALANDTLSEAFKRLKSSGIKPVIHCDRGCHYRWPGWIQITKNEVLYDQCQGRAVVLIILLVKDSLEE